MWHSLSHHADLTATGRVLDLDPGDHGPTGEQLLLGVHHTLGAAQSGTDFILG